MEVPKCAERRVFAGENARDKQSIPHSAKEHSAFSTQHSAKDAASANLSRRARDLFPHALEARVGHPGRDSSKLPRRAGIRAHFDERCLYEFSKTSEGLSSPRILECVS